MRPSNLRTSRFSLKPYRLADQERFLEMFLDKETQSYMGGISHERQVGKKRFQKILAVYERRGNARFHLIWGIYDQDRLCGHLELKDSRWANDEELEIFFMLHPQERSRGIIREVLPLIKRYQYLWGRQIVATIHPENVRSRSRLDIWGVDREETLHDPLEGCRCQKLYLSQDRT